MDRIEDIADRIWTTCKKKLDELMSVSDTLKRNLNEKINETLADLEKVEV